MYVKILESLGLATVRKQAPKVKLDPSKWEVDAATLQAVIAHRFDVMANYAKSIKRTSKIEIESLKAKGHDCGAIESARKWLHRRQKQPQILANFFKRASCALCCSSMTC